MKMARSACFAVVALALASNAEAASSRQVDCTWSVDPGNEVGVVDEFSAYVETSSSGKLLLTAWHTHTLDSDVVRKVAVTKRYRSGRTVYASHNGKVVLTIYRDHAPDSSLNGELAVTTADGVSFSHDVGCESRQPSEARASYLAHAAANPLKGKTSFASEGGGWAGTYRVSGSWSSARWSTEAYGAGRPAAAAGWSSWPLTTAVATVSRGCGS